MLLDFLPGGGPAIDPLAILLLALALDAAIGDPDWLSRVLPHPVALAGKLIKAGERRLNDAARGDPALLLRGLSLTAGVVLIAGALAWAITLVLARSPYGWVAEAVLAAWLLAGRSLFDHVRAVQRGLRDSLAAGRVAVSRIVGRDPESLDRAGISRAALESLAENFSDGVVAPVFWYALLGLPGLAAYKAVNTLDSMIGHRTPRYRMFGKAAARLDDLVNWLPARLAGALLVVAAAPLPHADAKAAWRAMLRDAPKHRSVNAGWQEAPLAGALDFALAGPRQYRDETVDDPWMGDGRKDLGPDDIGSGLLLYAAACSLLVAVLALAASVPVALV